MARTWGDTALRGVELTPKQGELIKKRQVANILAKLNAGKSITVREQRLLDEISGADQGFAPNLDVLGEECGVDRRTIDNARKRFGKDAPKKRADGRYPILEYKEWLAKHGITGRRKGAELEDELEVKLAHAQLRLERERFEFQRLKDQMLPVGQFEIALSRMTAAFLAALNAFGPRINESLEGLEYDYRAVLIENEVELLRKTLATCDYMAEDEDDEADE